ncbi:hypothetical protein GCM10027612_48900 [Microbispora bryophytorum subsp. camponoti]
MPGSDDPARRLVTGRSATGATPRCRLTASGKLRAAVSQWPFTGDLKQAVTPAPAESLHEQLATARKKEGALVVPAQCKARHEYANRVTALGAPD